MILLREMCRWRICGRAIGMCFLLTAIGCEQTVAPKAASMSAVSATRQDAVAGEAVRQAPTVVVRDADGHPVAGVRVIFFHPSGDPSQVASTDADGEAAVGWYASMHAGVDRLTARADGLASVDFVADVHAGPADNSFRISISITWARPRPCRCSLPFASPISMTMGFSAST